MTPNFTPAPQNPKTLGSPISLFRLIKKQYLCALLSPPAPILRARVSQRSTNMVPSHVKIIPLENFFFAVKNSTISYNILKSRQHNILTWV